MKKKMEKRYELGYVESGGNKRKILLNLMSSSLHCISIAEWTAVIEIRYDIDEGRRIASTTK